MTMINKETFTFLNKLASHNNREWFQENKELYLAAKENVDEFAQQIIDRFREVEPQIPAELTGKKSVMRIYRDVRFSKDKSPYKNNFGISISTSGKGVHSPGYFVQLQPGQSFVAGGLWMPASDQIKLIRQEIDYNGDQLLSILNQKDFKAYFGNGLDDGDKLKTTPKNYDADHPYIELLKLKSFTVSYPLTDEVLMSTKALDIMVACLKQIKPLNQFLKEAITV